MICPAQNQAGGGNIERKPEEGDEQEQGWKAREIGRFLYIKDGKQDQQRKGDAGGQETVQEKRVNGQDHDQNGHEQARDQENVAVFEKAANVRLI